MTDKLLPCPFCNGEAERRNPDHPHGGMVNCKRCGAEAFGPKWNARAALAAAPQPMGCGYPCGYDCNGACFDAAAPQPATPGQRMIRAAEEAVAIARGEAEPASVYPAAEHDWGKPVGKEVLPPYQTTPVDREALMEVIQQALWRCPDTGQMPDDAIADALLARGLRLPTGKEVMPDASARPIQQPDTSPRLTAGAQVEETMAWAVLGEDGALTAINYDRRTARHLCGSGERVVRVAIRVVEGGDDAA